MHIYFIFIKKISLPFSPVAACLTQDVPRSFSIELISALYTECWTVAIYNLHFFNGEVKGPYFIPVAMVVFIESNSLLLEQ